MKETLLRDSAGLVNLTDGSISGPSVHQSEKTIGQLQGIFRDQESWSQIPPDRVVYRVQWISPVENGTEGGLIWGNTTIEPGTVGDEFFMTHGHFHSRSDRGEFYTTVSGKGYLLMMDRNRHAYAETMSSGSLHYVPAETAHRAVNCGDEPLRFLACWPSDAGHDYESIAKDGFSIRVVARSGKPTIVNV